MKEIEVEIDGLRRMTVPELLKRYEDLFGKPARVKNRAPLETLRLEGTGSTLRWPLEGREGQARGVDGRN